MKVVLLHGPGLSSSRAKLSNIKRDFDLQEVVVFEEGSDIDRIKGSLMTIPLLSKPRLVILENPPEDLFSLTLDSSDLNLALWFDHEVSDKKPIMEWVKKLRGEVFSFPEIKEVSVFPFLDCLVSRDKKAFLELNKLKKGGYDIFYVITMIFYLLRNLVTTPRTVPSFVRQKLEKQRKNFDKEKIIKFYKEILEIEFKLKSGLLEKDQAEFILVNKFLCVNSQTFV